MSPKVQRTAWALPILGAIAILAIAFSVQRFEPHRLYAPGAAFALRSPVIARLGHTALQQFLSSHSGVPVIDPVLGFSTFLGGTNSAGLGGAQQQAYASFVDGPGNVYVTGPTNAPDFPVTAGTVQTTNASGTPISFLAKINPAGTALVFSTYLNLTEAPVLAVDGSGNIFVGGTNSLFSMPSGGTPFQAKAMTANSILIVKLNSTATQILAATYLSGSSDDFLSGLAVDSDGNLYVSGSTSSNDFPVKNAYQASVGSSGNSNFVSKLDPNLSTLLYSTYLGQSSGGQAWVAVDASKNAYTVSSALSGFPVTSGALQATCDTSNGGSICGTFAKLNTSATGSASLLYATYLGGSSQLTHPAAVAVDGSQNVYISGATNAGFPTVNSLQACSGVTNNGFVAKVNASGALVFSTCLGISSIPDVILDSSGIAYVTGSANATLPVVNPVQAIGNPSDNAPFVAAINTTAGSLLFSSFIGGDATFNSVGVDSAGNIIVSGLANDLTTTPFPVFNAFQPSPSVLFSTGCGRALCTATDAIIAKILPTAGASAALSPASVAFPALQVGTSSDAQAVNIIDIGSDALTVSNATATGDFSIQNGCNNVAAAGGTCTIQVTFTPTALGTRMGTLTITDTSAGSPRTVALSGIGGTATAALAPTGLTFASQQPNTTSPAQQVTLTNSGAIPLSIAHIDITGPFTETNQCGATLGAGQGCIIMVTFTPMTAGPATGSLSVTDGAADSPQSIPLNGTGGTPNLGLGVGPASSASATVTAGSDATYLLTVGGQGISGTASLTCTGAPTGASCGIAPTVMLSATTASTVNVGIKTTARSQLYRFPFLPLLWLSALAILAGLVYFGTASGHQRLKLRWSLVPLLALVCCACGGGSGSPNSGGGSGSNGTPAGTYQLVITAKSSSATQTLNLTLIVD
jgi:Beta-propeller repeat/Abnormal spindle-like microcephaly-assoc'd, ASPM-SPD-2-Hydin